jgi:putative membrane protein insertion efficiency factor
MKRIPIFFILMYQKFISPLLRPSCRFHPTCSEYSIQAITKYGATKGVFLSLKRILRCNPWGGSGLDPIPGEKENGCN